MQDNMMLSDNPWIHRSRKGLCPKIKFLDIITTDIVRKGIHCWSWEDTGMHIKGHVATSLASFSPTR